MAVTQVDGNTSPQNTPEAEFDQALENAQSDDCLLYTSPSPRDS